MDREGQETNRDEQRFVDGGRTTAVEIPPLGPDNADGAREQADVA